MATLEKIRSQQKLLFTIVIIALFLFIISIASADSIRRFFGPGTTIAQVGNHKIDYQDYRQLIDAQQQQQQTDRDELSQQAIAQLVQDALFEEQVDLLGIKVTDAEISNAMTGAVPHPAAQRFIQAACQTLGLPAATGSVLLDAINNPMRYNLTNDQLNYVAQAYFGAPSMAAAWANNEKAVEKNIQRTTFGNMLSGLFTANMLDAQSIYNDNSTNTVVTYVSSPYSAVSEDGIEVSDADLKAKYEEYKSLYKLPEETRLVDYIVVPITPSAADYQAADLEADRLAEALSSQPGLDGATASTKFLQDNHTVLVSDIKRDRDLALMPDSFIAKEKVYRYPRLGNVYRISKVLDVKPQIDSINISMYAAATPAQADSIKDLIDAGTTFAQIAEANPQQSVDSIWQSLVGAPADIAALFEGAVVGQTFVDIDSVKGTNAVYRVNSRKAPKNVAEIILFQYEVDPSNATVADIKTQLSSFLASNSKGDAFSANADSLYALRHAVVSASTPKLGYTGNNNRGMSDGVADSRHAIKWAMNAKKGQVSPILEDNRDAYVVVALKDIYSSDYVPYNAPQVSDALRAMVIADKKGAKLIEQYEGKAQDINGYAQLMGAEVRTDSAVVFSSPRFLTFGAGESALQGQVAAAQKGAVVGPVKGNNEVVVFVVGDSEVKGRPFNYEQDAQNFLRNFGINDAFTLLKGNRTVKNNTLEFENYDK